MLNNIKVAWVPKQASSFLTESGVMSCGGRIVHDDLTEGQAQSTRSQLDAAAIRTAGKYIIVYM